MKVIIVKMLKMWIVGMIALLSITYEGFRFYGAANTETLTNIAKISSEFDGVMKNCAKKTKDASGKF